MRMASIIEGIYKTHDVDFKFVEVLRQILEEENLIKDAYVEEIKYSIARFAKSIDATISIAPELKKWLDDGRSLQAIQQRRMRADGILLPASILSSAVFVGSALLYPANEAAGIAGMVSAIAVVVALAFKRGRIL